MKCWRCKAYGHRTGDRECPLSLSGNLESDAVRQAREDPMAAYVSSSAGLMAGAPAVDEEKRQRLELLTRLVREIREENRTKKERKRKRKEKKKAKKAKASSSKRRKRDR